MEDHQLRQAKSVLDLHMSHNQNMQIVREGSRQAVRVQASINVPTRSVSVPDFGRATSYPSKVGKEVYLTDAYRPRPYRRDWDPLETGWYDRSYSMAPYHWASHKYSGRRYPYMDPPYASWYYYPGTYYTPNYKWAAEEPRDASFYSRYRNADYDAPTAFPHRLWAYNPDDIRRGLRLFKRGLASYDQLDRSWLSPTAWDRRISQVKDVFVPGAYYGVKRYHYPLP